MSTGPRDTQSGHAPLGVEKNYKNFFRQFGIPKVPYIQKLEFKKFFPSRRRGARQK